MITIVIIKLLCTIIVLGNNCTYYSCTALYIVIYSKNCAY